MKASSVHKWVGSPPSERAALKPLVDKWRESSACTPSPKSPMNLPAQRHLRTMADGNRASGVSSCVEVPWDSESTQACHNRQLTSSQLWATFLFLTSVRAVGRLTIFCSRHLELTQARVTSKWFELPNPSPCFNLNFTRGNTTLPHCLDSRPVVLYISERQPKSVSIIYMNLYALETLPMFGHGALVRNAKNW